MRAFFVAASILLWPLAPSTAGEACNLRLMRDYSTQYLVSSPGAACQVQRLGTPRYGCRIWYGPDHGAQGFACGDLEGRWGETGNSAPIFGVAPTNSKHRRISAKFTPTNPEIAVNRQTLEYVTVSGKRRVAIAGNAKIACLNLYFFTETSPDKAKSREKDMDDFLADLRLLPANLSADKQKLACSGKN